MGKKLGDGHRPDEDYRSTLSDLFDQQHGNMDDPV
jgi:hypothetical protein